MRIGLGLGIGSGGGGGPPPTAPTLSLTSISGTNPPSWETTYTNVIIDTDEILMRYRVNGGAWINELPVLATSAWYDDYVIDGLPYVWPEFSADAPFPSSALIEIQEGIDRNGSVVWSAILSDTMNNSAAATFHQHGVMNYGYGTTPQPLTGGSFSIAPGNKLVVALCCAFNGSQTVTGVTMNSGAITLTRVGAGPIHQNGASNANKTYLYYVDAPGVSTITEMSVAVSGSTNIMGYSIYSVQNAVAGVPAATFGNTINTGSTDPVDMDGGLVATATGPLVLVGLMNNASPRTFTWTGAAELGERSESGWTIATAFQVADAPSNVTVVGASSGVGFSDLWQLNAVWEPV